MSKYRTSLSGEPDMVRKYVSVFYDFYTSNTNFTYMEECVHISKRYMNNDLFLGVLLCERKPKNIKNTRSLTIVGRSLVPTLATMDREGKTGYFA